jgi:PAS domain S-box-containing protein
LRVFLDNSAVIAWLKDDLGRYVFVSDNFNRRMGFARDGAVGKTDHQLAPADIADRLRENDLRLLSQGGPIEVAEATVNADGSTSWWLSNKFARPTVSVWWADWRWIIERKHAEQSLQLAATVFESQEGMFVDAARDSAGEPRFHADHWLQQGGGWWGSRPDCLTPGATTLPLQ